MVVARSLSSVKAIKAGVTSLSGQRKTSGPKVEKAASGAAATLQDAGDEAGGAKVSLAPLELGHHVPSPPPPSPSAFAAPTGSVRLKERAQVLKVMSHGFKEARIRSQMAEAQEQKEAVVTEVESNEHRATLRLWQQGDEALQTREALEERWRNRSDPEIWRVLNQSWWTTAQTSLEAEAGGASFDEFEEIPREAYVGILMRMNRAMLEADEQWDEEEARKIAEAAWDEDSRGLAMMTRSMFNDALFEFVDGARCSRQMRGARTHNTSPRTHRLHASANVLTRYLTR